MLNRFILFEPLNFANAASVSGLTVPISVESLAASPRPASMSISFSRKDKILSLEADTEASDND